VGGIATCTCLKALLSSRNQSRPNHFSQGDSSLLDTAWHPHSGMLLLLLRNLNLCQGLRNLLFCHPTSLHAQSLALGIDLRSPPADSPFLCFFRQINVGGSALRSATGRSPKSQIYQQIMICWCVPREETDSLDRVHNRFLSRIDYPDYAV
jgi:hypothetical protein